MQADVPIPESYWVIHNQLIAGQYPADRFSEAITLQNLRKLTGAGVSCYVDLTQAGELSPYDGYLPQLSKEYARSIEYHRLPIRDMNVPTRAVMVTILDLIDHEIADGHTVYVHCWGGIGRTGTVVGCFLARHGTATGQAALEQIARLRRDTPRAREGRASPETPAQDAMVVNWQLGI